jgi:Xaa-Pro aminopeptidase
MGFGDTEQLARSRDRARESSAKLIRFLGSRPDLRGVVLTGPGAVAWSTGGGSRPVDRAASVDLVWVVITSDTAVLVTTEVEHDRVRDECDPTALGFELVAVPWFDDQAFVRAAEDAAGVRAALLGSDGHAAFGVDVTDELVSLRMALTAPERDELRSLGAATAEALETALRGWVPGERDVEIQARVASGLEAAGADAPVLIVGGDDRVARYRHPMAIGRPVERLAMTVTVARRAGLHAAATRFASAGRLDDGLEELRSRVLQVDEALLASSRVGATYGSCIRSSRSTGGVARPLPGRSDRIRTAGVRDRPGPARRALVRRAGRRRTRRRVEPEPPGWGEGRGHVSRGRGRARTCDCDGRMAHRGGRSIGSTGGAARGWMKGWSAHERG